MRNILYSGIAAAMLLTGSMFAGANAMPAAPHTAIAQASGLPVVEARAHFRSHTMRHFNRGHHYGWTRGRGNPHRFHHGR